MITKIDCSTFIDKLAADVSPKYTGKAYRSSEGQAVLKSFPGLPGNTIVTTDTSYVNSKPVGVLNTAKTPSGNEYQNIQNLLTGKSETKMVPKGTMPGSNSFYDGRYVRTTNLQQKALK